MRHQIAAAEAATAAGVWVTYEPATERLATDGFGLEKYACYTGRPYHVGDLFASPSQRSALVETVIHAHPGVTTVVSAPHFYVDHLDTAHLNA